MKKYLVIISLFLITGFSVVGQEDDVADDKMGKLQQRMTEYIQKKLNLTRGEAEKFRPVFVRYLLELRKTHREFKGDRPVLQLKIAELRVKVRNECRDILDEPRANKIFEYQREFEIKVKDELDRRKLERPGGIRRTKSLQD